jgi:hypothetical protein
MADKIGRVIDAYLARRGMLVDAIAKLDETAETLPEAGFRRAGGTAGE